MDKRLFKLTIFLVLILAILVGAFVVNQGKKQSPDQAMAAPLSKPSPLPNVKPTSTPTAQLVGSPDGKSELELTREQNGENYNWTLIVDGKRLFSNNYPLSTKVEVPFNTFAPDNKYVFLKIDANGVVSYPVFEVKKESSQSAGMDLASLFYDKFQEFKITEATGWGGVNLIVFNTTYLNGEKGPSFWFEVPTKRFIRLSNRFE